MYTYAHKGIYVNAGMYGLVYVMDYFVATGSLKCPDCVLERDKGGWRRPTIGFKRYPKTDVD